MFMKIYVLLSVNICIDDIDVLYYYITLLYSHVYICMYVRTLLSMTSKATNSRRLIGYFHCMRCNGLGLF